MATAGVEVEWLCEIREKDTPMSLYELSARLNNGRDKKLGDYEGKVLLIVNTASKCGFTPQYRGLQGLYAKYKEQGFEVLGFPCDQFGHQEPGDDAEIKSFCETNYGVEFPMFAKIEVNGTNTHPVFEYLKSKKGGLFGDTIKWNFTKFLVAKDGKVVDRYAPVTPPERITADIERELGK
jgi:glutathione peroxidase